MTKIEVTQADIAVPGTGNCNCPIWHAIKRVCRPEIPVSVGYTHARIYSYSSEPRISMFLPQIAQRFIANVSRHPDAGEGKPLEPITFELDVPAWALRETATP